MESIRAQTQGAWICLISDDGSIPITWARCARDRRRPTLRVDGERDRRGFYGNYERALAAVPPGADLVALADQDDRWDPEKLEALLASIGDRELVYGDMRVVDAGAGG